MLPIAFHLYQNFKPRKMEALTRFKKEITIHHLTESNRKDFIQLNKSFLLTKDEMNEMKNNSNIVLFATSYDTITGYCILKSLFSNKDLKKQAVLLSSLWGTDRLTTKELIRESIKYSWEIGYHTAFALYESPSLIQAGFEPVSKFKIKDMVYVDILGMELSWDGFKKTSRTLTTNTTALEKKSSDLLITHN